MQPNIKFAFFTGPRLCLTMPSSGNKSVACSCMPCCYLVNLALNVTGW